MLIPILIGNSDRQAAEFISFCACAFTEVFSGPPWRYAWLNEESAARYINSIVHRPGFRGYLYAENDKSPPVGFCLGCVNDYFNTAAAYEIVEILVKPAFQKHGAGTRMLAEVELTLSQEGICAVILHTGRDLPAFNWYLKNGYETSEQNVTLSKLIKQPQ